MKGIFITIYGINNIGKSTHSRILVERLKKGGYDAVYFKYPIYNLAPTGPKINKILRSKEPQKIDESELQTLFMQNRLDFEPELKRMLDSGKIVVAEDYSGTGIAWGTAKGLDQKWVEDLNKDLLKEDFSIMIRGKRDVRMIEINHIHETNEKLVSKVQIILEQLAAKFGWHIVELREKITDTAAAIWAEVNAFLAERKK